MEKVIQEHLYVFIHQLSLIVDNITIKLNYKGGYVSDFADEDIFEEREYNVYTFHIGKNSANYIYYNIENMKEEIDHTVEHDYVVFKQSGHNIELKVKNRTFVWIDGLLHHEIIEYDYNGVKMEIHHLDNAVKMIRIGFITVVYDLANYLKYYGHMPIKYDDTYTFNEILEISSGRMNLVDRRGKIFFWIDENRKVNAVGYDFNIRFNYTNRTLNDFLNNPRDVNVLVSELEILRRDPKHYNLPLINSLARK